MTHMMALASLLLIHDAVISVILALAEDVVFARPRTGDCAEEILAAMEALSVATGGAADVKKVAQRPLREWGRS